MMMTKKERIIRYRNRGYSAKETEMYMKGQATLSYIYKIRSEYIKSNVATSKDSTKKSRILNLLDEDKAIEEIARILDCSTQYIYQVQREAKEIASVAKLPNKKYSIIYADPPWRYKAGRNSRSTENHYPTLPIKQIYRLPVQSIADDDCVLFLWVTFPLLKEGLKTIENWGFQYKTVAFNWIKSNSKATNTIKWNGGHWTRSNSEICLLATKGKPNRISNKVHSVVLDAENENHDNLVISPIEAHSKKPDSIRHHIVELMGDLPRIELFARQHHEGWDNWGNEVLDI